MEMEIDSVGSIYLTPGQAQALVTAHLSQPDSPANVLLIQELQSDYYTSSVMAKSYILTLTSPHPPIIVLLTLPPDASISLPLHPLSTFQHLHTLIAARTGIPLPSLHMIDTSCSLLQYHYAVFLAPALAPSPQTEVIQLHEAQSRLSSQEVARIELQRGAFLKQIHGLQNDFFGTPSVAATAPMAFPSLFTQSSDEAVYTWQEVFSPLLDTLLDELSQRYPDLVSWEALRLASGRAIAFYLFDDVEVPSLTGGAAVPDETWISLPEAAIVCMHPASLLHAQWGDPLLEAALLPPGPSDALLEAYNGGAPLTVFSRQRTKRLWYLFYLAGKKLCHGAGGQRELEVMKECAEKLKDAPCY